MVVFRVYRMHKCASKMRKNFVYKITEHLFVNNAHE